jgi:O-acetyl-ADP-ribose deacetylase (regulator of RNase III)
MEVSMISRHIDGVTVELIRGDITRQEDLDVVVNAANARLEPGGGVAGAIHRAAGPDLLAACRPLAPIEPGEAVITDACDLPNRRIVHCLGPVHGVDEPAEELLAACYRRALELADAEGLESIGFPAISTGAFGYPLEDAAKVALETINSAAPGLEHVRRIRFILFGKADLDTHARILQEAQRGAPG